ncbi:MAG: hypothetical protein DRI40_04845 [Chloroflexi bacterium]|nr:MAG: hypothetical protein DRI40_04845 [Chloroflexota bacterium]
MWIEAEMGSKTTIPFSDSDILFLVETVEPRLADRIDTFKDDPVIVEGMLEQEAERVFQRITTMGEEVLARISPRFLFEVLLRKTRREIESQKYTVERTATQRVPVFDANQVAEFLANRSVLTYLADMLTSFVRIESYVVTTRVRKGIWRKLRFNDMDIDCLTEMCQAVDEEYRFGFYKRIADVCLFISGMYPEYAAFDYRYPSLGEARPSFTRRLRRDMADYEEEGRRFYKLAAEHQSARLLELSEVFWLLHGNFAVAKKPLNFMSEHYLQHRKSTLFGLRGE